MMNKFTEKVNLHTKVKLPGSSEWYSVCEVHETRQWIRIRSTINGELIGGWFQRSQIEKFKHPIQAEQNANAG